MRIASLLLISILSITYSNASFADWQLDNGQSSLNFISTKNQHINESHSFTQLSGTISDSGAITVNVDLTTVETNIPIRNERMQAYLFNIKDTPSATLSAQLDSTSLALKSGQSVLMTVPSTITINGIDANYDVQVRVNKHQNGDMSATTVKPILVQAASHKLIPGLDKLKELAGLNGIGFVSPVTFSVVFSAQ
ncbi:YceI family protein [Aliiglaciecola sp.]|nr:YceI family protein [Aliiglaciecola sp.]